MKFILSVIVFVSSSIAFASYSSGDHELSKDTLEQKKLLVLEQIKRGEVVLSKVVLIDEGRPVCGIDLSNQPNLVPHFASAPPSNFHSAVAFNDDLPFCSADLKQQLSYLSSQNQGGFTLEGEQTAAVPAALATLLSAFVPAAVGCGFGFFGEPIVDTMVSDLNSKTPTTLVDPLIDPFVSIGDTLMSTGNFLGATAIGSFLGMGITASALTTAETTRSAVRFLIKGAAMGALYGMAGYLICGPLVYVLEYPDS